MTVHEYFPFGHTDGGKKVFIRGEGTGGAGCDITSKST